MTGEPTVSKWLASRCCSGSCHASFPELMSMMRYMVCAWVEQNEGRGCAASAGAAPAQASAVPMFCCATDVVVGIENAPGLVGPDPIASADKTCGALASRHDRLLDLPQRRLWAPAGMRLGG